MDPSFAITEADIEKALEEEMRRLYWRQQHIQQMQNSIQQQQEHHVQQFHPTASFKKVDSLPNRVISNGSDRKRSNGASSSAGSTLSMPAYDSLALSQLMVTSMDPQSAYIQGSNFQLNCLYDPLMLSDPSCLLDPSTDTHSAIQQLQNLKHNNSSQPTSSLQSIAEFQQDHSNISPPTPTRKDSVLKSMTCTQSFKPNFSQVPAPLPPSQKPMALPFNSSSSTLMPPPPTLNFDFYNFNSPRTDFIAIQVVGSEKDLSHDELFQWKGTLANAFKSGTIPPSQSSREAISVYLKSDCCETTLYFYTPCIGQKSYGSEKRFFCPPPLVQLQGPSAHHFIGDAPLSVMEWQGQHPLVNLSVSADISGNLLSEDCGGQKPSKCQVLAGNTDKPQFLSTFRGVFASDLRQLPERRKVLMEQEMKQKPFPTNIFQQLKNRFGQLMLEGSHKDFELYLNMEPVLCKDVTSPALNAGQFLSGVFQSSKIYVISKPTKKRATRMENTNKVNDELHRSVELVLDGQMIALYNRLRSQTISTKFMCLDRSKYSTLSKPCINQLTSKTCEWDAFRLVEVEPRRNRFSHMSGQKVIEDGAVVVLECPQTQWRSPPLILRKVESDNRCQVSPFHDEATPLTQLQKIALQLRDSPDCYLSLDKQSLRIVLVQVSGEASGQRVFNWSDEELSPDSENSSENGSSTAATKRSRTSISMSPDSFKRQRMDNVWKKIPESAVWTIVAASCTRFQWFDPRPQGIQSLPEDMVHLPVTPTPVLRNLFLADPQHNIISKELHCGSFNRKCSTMALEIEMTSYALLDALRRLDSDVLSSLSALSFDVYIGNVPCPLLSIHHEVEDLLKEAMASQGSLDRLPQDVFRPSFTLKQLCLLPTWQDCFVVGQWWKNLPFEDDFVRKCKMPSAAEELTGSTTSLPCPLTTDKKHNLSTSSSLTHALSQAALSDFHFADEAVPNLSMFEGCSDFIQPSLIFGESSEPSLTTSGSAWTSATDLSAPDVPVVGTELPVHLCKVKVINMEGSRGRALIEVPILLVRRYDGLVYRPGPSVQFEIPVQNVD